MNSITEITRRDILDFIQGNNIDWWGRLEEISFLSRLYDLESLPSKDYRYETASGDIYQHRVNNYDWKDDWIFYDDRFNLLRGSDEDFLKFLCEILHPIVRSNENEVEIILNKANDLLKNDGWQLYERENISGRPIFDARQINGRIEVLEEPTGWPLVVRQANELRRRLQEAENEEQFQAVGLLCREALISVAQYIYDPEIYPAVDGVTPSKTDANRMLKAFIAVELKGGSNEEVRRHAKASLSLAIALQHNRTADFRTAAICAEATVSVINIVGILSKNRFPALQN